MAYVFALAILAVAALLTVGSRFIEESLLNRLRRGSALIIGAATLARCILLHEAVFDVRGLNMYSPFGDLIPQTVFAIILVWFTYAALLDVVLAQFFDIPILHSLTKYFAIPVFALDLIFFNTYVTAIVGKGAFTEFDFRIPLIMIEIALALAVAVSRLILPQPRLT